jgi:hypothetical protein
MAEIIIFIWNFFSSVILFSAVWRFRRATSHPTLFFVPTLFFALPCWPMIWFFQLPTPPPPTPTPTHRLGVWVFALRDECWKIIVMVWKKGDSSLLFEPIKLPGAS